MKQSYRSDKMAMTFLVLAMSYLLTGILLGVVGSFQYLLPSFLKEQLSFQKSRPLHVYLVIAWIFTAAQGSIYYFVPRIAKKELYWPNGIRLHFWMQLLISFGVVSSFLMGHFGGREYLEFPPAFGLLIFLSWLPFAINVFATLKPDYKKAPVYTWSWSAGIIFFFITLSESYLWLIDYFNNNVVRDTTVQWKALGSMVGSWNMLVYGSSMSVMEKLSGDIRASRKWRSFFFFFLGLANLMFNWGHHTYIIPAAPWVKTVAYLVSMTELLIFGHLVYQWRKTLTRAQKNFHRLPYRLLSFADAWIFLNLGVAIAMSIPALNYFTHGTHITVAHAMGATIGINTMLLFASVFYIVQKERPFAFELGKKRAASGIAITNIALIIFWTSLIGSGLVKIASNLEGDAFSLMMKKCAPFFRLFAFSGVFILAGILITVIATMKMISAKPAVNMPKNRSVEAAELIA